MQYIYHAQQIYTMYRYILVKISIIMLLIRTICKVEGRIYIYKTQVGHQNPPDAHNHHTQNKYNIKIDVPLGEDILFV